MAVTVIVAGLACAEQTPDPAAVRLAALTASAAADVLSDLAAVDDPDAAGVRDALHAANVTALSNAARAHDSAPHATAAAYALSLEAAEAAGTFADVLGEAIEARARSQESFVASESAMLIAEMVELRADTPRLQAESNRLKRKAARLLSAYRGTPDPVLSEDGRAAWEAWRTASDEGLAAARALGRNRRELARAELQLGILASESPTASASLADDANVETVAEAATRALTLAEEHAISLIDTAAKVAAAESGRDLTVTAYRNAASAWREITTP